MKRGCVMMAAMWKRLPPGITILLVAVAILLPSLALLQYRWLGQLSEGERERMQSLLRSAALQFTQAFDAEIARAYSTFQRQKIGELDKLSDEYAQRFEDWKSSATHPPLLRELLVVTADESGALRLWRLNAGANGLEPTEWASNLSALREQITRPGLDVIREELPALVIPPEDSFKSRDDKPLVTQPRFVCAIAMLDLDYIRSVFLPALAERYFPSRNGLGYNLAVISRGDAPYVIFTSAPAAAAQPAAPGLTLGLFDLRLETLLGRNARARAAEHQEDSPNAVVRIVKRQPISGDQEEAITGRWRLQVSYQAGSLEEAIASGRRRNLGISFGVLLLLAVSVGLIVVSTVRASRLAQDQMKFVAGVSHELRTPLAVICSAGENLADKVVGETPQAAEYGRVIRDEGRRLAQMVEQVLEYAGAQSGRPAYELREAQADKLLAEATADLRNEAAKAGFEIESEIEPGLPFVKVDAAALGRSLQNLVSNAIKYDRGQRWIGLTARRANGTANAGEIQITISDRGRGIFATDLPHIFEPFYRGREATAEQIKGSGLGLSLVQHMAAAHGGRVTVRSTPGEGSAFTIHLPIVPAAGSDR
jgi:signal transduction histidine kinase